MTIGLTVIDVLGQPRFNSKDASAYALTLCEGGWQQTRSKCFPGLSQGPSMFPACNKAVTIKLPICKRLNRLWSQALILYVAPGARLARAPQPLQHARRPSRSNCPYGAHQGQRDSAALQAASPKPVPRLKCWPPCRQAIAWPQLLHNQHPRGVPTHALHVTSGSCLAWQWSHAGRNIHMHVAQLHGRSQ